MTSLLEGGETLRILLSDERTVIGTLECLDNDRNLILSDCVQIKEGERTLVGNVMVRGENIRKVELKKVPAGEDGEEKKKTEGTSTTSSS